MKLYYLTGACSMASLISLHESGVKFETAALDRKTRKTADGLDFDREVNSKGYVPALRLDDGQVLTENVAVLLYIADLNPAAKLAPAAGTLERYRVIEWLAFVNSEIHKNYTPLFGAVSEDVKQYARGNLTKRLDWLNTALGSKHFLTGDTFTFADAYLFVVLGWSGHVGIEIGKWPNLKRFRSDLQSRPSVKSALKAEGLDK
jgi:glutathione S-transferase